MQENIQEQVYWSYEVCEVLGIKDSTLRKWCLILERDGWQFLRDANHRRAFRDRDVMMLRKFKELTQSGNVTLEEASKAVISMFSVPEETAVTIPVTDEAGRHDHRYEELSRKVDMLIEQNVQQNAVIKELIERLDKQQRFIEEKLLERDRQLVETIRQLQEPKHKKKWWQFWKE